VLTDVQRTLGEIACSGLKGYYREACIHDVGLSGSTDLVKDYYSNTEDLNAMADKLITPNVTLAEYELLSTGIKTNLPSYSGEGFQQTYRVVHKKNDGQFMLTIRPPRNATAFFSTDSAGANTQSFTSEGTQEVKIDVQCKNPDPLWMRLGDAWPHRGALQLWAIDPLSGFTSQLLGEISISCVVNTNTVGRVAAGNRTSFAVDNFGQLWGWGTNEFGSLGYSKPVYDGSPVLAEVWRAGSSTVTAVWTGTMHTLALDEQDRLLAWGNNNYGQLGDGTKISRNQPTVVDLTPLGSSKVVTASAGVMHTHVLDDQGRLWSWGINSNGALGIGTTTDQLRPVQVDLAQLNNAKVVALASGYLFTILLDDQNRIWAWGGNVRGQLGDGTTAFYQTRPVLVDLAALNGSKVISISAGDSHAIALDDLGRVWTWGRNSEGQLGDGTYFDGRKLTLTKFASSPNNRLVAVAAGRNHSLALDEHGHVWGWGSNSNGQIGDGSVGGRGYTQPSQPDISSLNGSKFSYIIARSEHTLAIDDQGNFWHWGQIGPGFRGDSNPITPRKARLPPLNMN